MNSNNNSANVVSFCPRLLLKVLKVIVHISGQVALFLHEFVCLVGTFGVERIHLVVINDRLW